MKASASTHYSDSEILSQPDTWRAVLEELTSSDRTAPPVSTYDVVIFAGCGSTYYLAQWAAREAQRLHGVTCLAAPSSDLLVVPQSIVPRAGRALLVAISRSGETTETLRALETFTVDGRRDSIAITCYPDRLLAQRARWSLGVPAAGEKSVVQTRSFTSMMLAIAWWLGGEPPAQLAATLAEACRRLLASSEATAQRLGSDSSLRRYFYLGSGPLFGLASEAMLKIKEMSLAHAEAYHFPEIRHGPMSLVGPESLVIGLVGEEAPAAEARVLQDMRALGGRTVAVAEAESPELTAAAETVVPLSTGLPPLWRAPLYLPFLHRMALHRALAHGLDPDHPAHLTQVVVLHD